VSSLAGDGGGGVAVGFGGGVSGFGDAARMALLGGR
jgi:hypothetical protein